MEPETLHVQTFGEIALCWNGARIDDSSSRSRKVWLLIAYLLYHRGRMISSEELCRLLWRDAEQSANPLNALKTTLHRVRSLLDWLGEDAGHRLILCRDGSYTWNSEVPLRLDCEQFAQLCQAGRDASTQQECLALWRQALSLYQGNFLSKLSCESWVVPLQAQFRGLYLDTAMNTLSLLEKEERWEEAAELCQAVLVQEPCLEDGYRRLMEALLRLERYQQAVDVYGEASRLLRAEMGVSPSQELLTLYREAVRSANGSALSPAALLDQLREPSGAGGAMVCGYDLFKVIYQSVARSVARSGDAVHLALFSLSSVSGKELPKHSLDRAADNLQEVIRTQLRRGDVAARCGNGQFVCLLLQAGFESSNLVCRRITKAFARQYPHSPAGLQTCVLPLEPYN